ncbi:hypothetical protein ACQEVS_02055 [Streptomyces sp. CA-181903]|uniref:hypothetical protein n=1 Tax=Streptomyces sp. CA-181903 TaxID=3240055 RepID=UPI003D89E261
MARETTAPTGGGFRPVHHPAGLDDALRIAVEEVWAGRWMAMRDLLDRTGADWALRTARTQVLGAVAAGSTIVEAWAAEEGHSVDARVMWARVVVQRAQRAHRQRHPEAVHLEHQAREACRLAVEAAPGDPVPWICLLTLASLDERQERPEHQLQPWEIMLPPGPWGLLSRIWERDQCNREAFHRMLQFFQSCTTGAAASVSAVDFARWVASWAPAGSALLALPLFAYADLHRRQAADPRGRAGRTRCCARSGRWTRSVPRPCAPTRAGSPPGAAAGRRRCPWPTCRTWPSRCGRPGITRRRRRCSRPWARTRPSSRGRRSPTTRAGRTWRPRSSCGRGGTAWARDGRTRTGAGE